MAKRLTITYNHNTCVGQGNCCQLAPNNFQFSNGKAVLIGAKPSKQKNFIMDVNCSEGQAELLIKAAKACPVNAIQITDTKTNQDLVTVNVEESKAKEVIAKYDDNKEFVLDPLGYFLIRVDRKKNNIEVGFCNEKNKIILKVIGKKPIDIYTTVLNKEQLPIRRDHAAYLGRELQKAYLALQQGIEYVQDEELDFSKKVIIS